MQKRNKPHYITTENLHHFISEALKEDVGSGDHSSLAILPESRQDKARLLVKEDGILAGVEMAKEIFHFVDPNLKIEVFLPDGTSVEKGQVAFHVEGAARSILTAERLALNCMQRMSGIASLTHQMVQEIAHTSTQLLDTRKTTPNFRLCEKWAVFIGGGTNHRFGLYDMIMLKDNHIDYAGGIAKAVNEVRNYLHQKQLSLKIEVETRNLDEVKQALDAKVDRIMLDNFSIQATKEAVDYINKACETEASGGITLQTLKKVAETGVDFISSGAVTHSAKNIDLSLKAMK